MFGDIGHGSILLLTGIFLCLLESCLRPRLPSMEGFFKMRYLFLLLGIFSTFTGLVYNDMMSIPLYLFNSCYDKSTGKKTEDDCIYPFGVDPAWYTASNELTYMNSMKMKIAVILGVLQMSLGVLMKAFNAIYFRKSVDFWHEFVPQILLLWVLFGYMDILIIMKWTTNYEGREGEAPSIITFMINMFLSGGTILPHQSLIGSEKTNQVISIIFLCKLKQGLNCL